MMFICYIFTTLRYTYILFCVVMRIVRFRLGLGLRLGLRLGLGLGLGFRLGLGLGLG